MELMDFTELIDVFGVPLKVYPKDATGGKYIGTEWVKNELPEPLEVNEPFIPSSLDSKQPLTNSFLEGGRIERHDMIWYSLQKVKLQSTVEFNGLKYSVEEATSFEGYANVTQYGCKAVNAFE